jgi:hypothetical protein
VNCESTERPARRATVRTTHECPDLVAAAVRPDNTEEMTTHVKGEEVVTRIERETTGGLQATVDDYVTNLRVADSIVSDRFNTQP